MNDNDNIIKLATIAAIMIVVLTVLVINFGGRFNSSWSPATGFCISIEAEQTPVQNNDCLPVPTQPGKQPSFRL